VKRVPAALRYTVLRLLAFVVPLLLLVFLTGLQPWIAAIIAAVIGLCVSYIFLRRPRETVAQELYARRHGDKPVPHDDEDSEDAALDARAATTAEATSAADAGRVEERQTEDHPER
jgi:L-lactate permease